MKNSTNSTAASFQELNLSIGERAICAAGYPKKSTVIVECIKDFDFNGDLWSEESDVIINNASNYVKVTEHGLIGLSTSHLSSSNWKRL